MAVLCNNVIAGASIAEEAAGGDSAYQIEKSLRFDSGDQDNLSLTPGVGNKRTFTISVWFKRPKIGDETNLLGNYNTTSGNWEGFCFYVNTDDHIEFHHDNGSSYDIRHRTTAKFRDPSAWYHAVVAVDTTVSEPSHRVRLYVNGKEITDFNSSVNVEASQNLEMVMVPASQPFNIGHQYSYGDGYLSDFYFIDGLALSPAAFGSFDSTGVWNPKALGRPTPNNGTTWSTTGLTSPDGTISNPEHLFDGKSNTFCGGSNGHTVQWTLTTPISVTSTVSLGSGGADGEYVINPGKDNELVVQMSGSLGGGTEYKTVNFTGDYYGFKFKPSSGGFWAQGIKIDNVLLIDDQTDQSTFNNPNDGRKWSDHWTGTQNSGGYSATEAHDGIDAASGAGSRAQNGSTVKLTLPTAVPCKNLRVHGTLDNGTIKVNGTDVSSSFESVYNWYTVTGLSTFSSIELIESSGNSPIVGRIQVDGVELLDDVTDNSFHLKFNDATKDRYLGKDTLNGKIADATGGLPIYNTTDDYGDVKGSGYRSDSSAGTTDGTGLVFAVAGDTLTDIHAGINTGSSNNTLNDDSNTVTQPVVSTSDSRFYGSSIKFAGLGQGQLYTAANADFTLGTDDFTVEFWFRQISRQPASPGHSGGLFRISQDDFSYAWDGNFHISIAPDGALNVAYDQSKTLNGTAGDVELNKWHHLAVTKQSNLQILYIDGVEKGRTTHTGIDVDEGDRIVLGNYTNHRNSVLDGYMQDVRLYRGVVKYTSNFKPPTRKDFTVNNLRTTTVSNDYLTSQWSGDVRSFDDTHGARKMFDGEPPDTNNDTGSVFSSYSNGSSCTWTPTGTIQNITKLELFMRKSGSNGPGQFEINGTNEYSNVSDWDGWNTWTNISTLTSIKIGYSSGNTNEAIGLKGIRINDELLIDGHLPTDSLVDTPTNYGTDTGAGGEVRGNYCTLNPLDKELPSLSKGNLNTGTAGTTSWKGVRGTIGISSGKWYWETTLLGMNSDSENGYYVGVATRDASLGATNQTGQYSRQTTTKSSNGTYTNNFFTDTAVNDVLGIAIDMDAKKMWISKNNSWTASGNPSTGANQHFTINAAHDEVFPWMLIYNSTINFDVNFGQRAFKYTAPTDFKALCTQNLDDTFSGDELNNPSKFFDTKTWAGRDFEYGNTRTFKGWGFGPDLVWIKARDDTYSHSLWDQTRGNARIESDTQDSEVSNDSGGYISAFTSDGFTFTKGSSTSAYANQSWNGGRVTYVGWGWDAGTAAATASTDGSTTPSAQWVNATAGFSISKYTGTGADATIGHGLGAKPEFMMFKELTNPSNDSWAVYHKDLTNIEKWLPLNTNDAEQTYADEWNETHPTNTVAHIGAGGRKNQNGNTNIMYCWAPIAGYSAFGTYEGNGNANGPFVYTGFKPRWILLKDIDASREWSLWDTERRTFNPQGAQLYAHSNVAEQSQSERFDILANGFKIKNGAGFINENNETFIYAAFAESPFKLARAV